ncbi:MAG: VWA domain-containing protein [Candidatus Korobacteraceae bacterium]
MTLQRPGFLLLLLLLPVLWTRLRAMPGASRTCLILKCAAFAMLAVALSDPWIHLPQQKLALTVVVDTSASISRDSLQKSEEVVRDLIQNNSDAELRMVTVAGQARVVPLPQRAASAIPQNATPEAASATDLEAGLQLALRSLPQQGARRILLLSDGNENRGQVLSAALRAREQGVRVFTKPIGATALLPVQAESMAVPREVFSGERFTISTRLQSSKALAARVAVTFQGRELGAAKVQLQSGSNPVDMDLRITGNGMSLLELRVSGEGAESVLFSQAVMVRRPRVLYLTYADRPSQQLLEILKRADVDVNILPDVPHDLPSRNWDAVLLDNYPGRELMDWENQALHQYVVSGGGLIFIGGEHNSRLPEEPRTAFEKLLPVRGDPDIPDDSMALVLVLDRSGSMNGEKIIKAREAAAASLATLRPEDRVGIIAFNDTFQWVAPIAPATDIPRLAALIHSINAEGSTRIYPPIRAGFQAILQEKVTRRHILVMTDGVSVPDDLPALLQQAATQRVTISTIGVGADVVRQMLEDIARTTQGKAYFVDRAADLPQVMSEEIRNAKISQIREEPVGVVAAQPSEATDGIDFAHAPKLLGFVRAKEQTGAETILTLEEGEPLLVRWQFGLGRVVAFLSDSGARWATNWVPWNSYGTFWPQIVRDVSSRDRHGRIGVRAGSTDGEEIVFYDLLDGTSVEFRRALRQPGGAIVRVEGPSGAVQSFPLVETAPDHYEARILSRQQGMYRVLFPGAKGEEPQTAFYRDLEETKPKLVNHELLKQIAEVTGGSVDADRSQLLSSEGSYYFEPYALWPYFLILALGLNFVELAIRKGVFRDGLFARRS